MKSKNHKGIKFDRFVYLGNSNNIDRKLHLREYFDEETEEMATVPFFRNPDDARWVKLKITPQGEKPYFFHAATVSGCVLQVTTKRGHIIDMSITPDETTGQLTASFKEIRRAISKLKSVGVKNPEGELELVRDKIEEATTKPSTKVRGGRKGLKGLRCSHRAGLMLS